MVRCVNDTNGDGDCAACSRNPEALCLRCPDDGRCWHHCKGADCFRVRYCSPLSSHGERWSPEEVAAVLAAADTGVLG